MPAARTEITEIVTGLGMLGHPTAEEAVAARPAAVRNVDDATWERLADLAAGGRHRAEFGAAWANGRAFLASPEALRGRVPRLVEWKGGHRAPGDEVLPVDLRVDHVYLVSCKYLSRLLHNTAPAHLFDRALTPGPRPVGGDWFAEVAPAEHQALYEVVRTEVPGTLGLPAYASDLTAEHRSALREHLTMWSTPAREAYRRMGAAVASSSAERWRTALRTKAQQESMLWRLLRLGSAPYFVLGVGSGRSLRLRVCTPWDWRQAHDLRRFEVWGDDAGQPQVRWRAVVRDRALRVERAVEGRVEVRWSHGRFGQRPEAKVLLDTPHEQVPGYVPICAG